MKEWKLIEVENSIEIPFLWRDPTPGGQNLGRAEFYVCQIFKYHKPIGYYVYPLQQRNMNEYWHVSRVDFEGITINSYGGLSDAKVWRFFWCKEHKTISFSLYAPTDAKILRLDSYGLEFLKTSWNK